MATAIRMSATSMTQHPSSPDPDFWERPEQVERFTKRDPDHRLIQLLQTYSQPDSTRVLDIGCAGGRNTILLAQLAFDFHALDSSAAMVARTRERVASIVGQHSAAERVRQGVMENMCQYIDGYFHLVVALGVYHEAASSDRWNQALSETHRVLRPDGLVLTATFSPRSRAHGETVVPVPGQVHLYEGFRSGLHYLLEADELDEAMKESGFVPHVDTTTVVVSTTQGQRVTVNGLFRKSQ